MREDNNLGIYAYTETGDGMLISPRVHPSSVEILEVAFGEAEIRIGTEVVFAMAGDFVFVPPTLVFSVVSVGGSSSVRVVRFDSESFLSVMDKIDTELLYMFYLQARTRVALFKPSHPLYAIFKGCLADVYDESLSRDVCHKLRMLADLYVIVTAVLRYYFAEKDEEGERAIYHNVLRLRPAIEYIAEHYSDKLYIELLSEMIDVSADYFTKMFRDSIGKTPVEYINSLRVNRAMQLLFETDLSMAEIADEIGFCNPNYFHKIFKQYIDMSPLAYRKNSKK